LGRSYFAILPDFRVRDGHRLAFDLPVLARRGGGLAELTIIPPNAGFEPARRFAIDSPLEGAVLSELSLMPNSLLAGKIQGIL